MARSPIDVTASELMPDLEKALRARFIIALEGDPGSGKTQIIDLCGKNVQMPIIYDHPAISDPTDYKGLPVMQKDGSARFAPIGLLCRLLSLKVPTIIFVDDFGQAAPATQAAFMQLFHGGVLNEHKIPMHLISWVIATNSTADRAAVNALLEPVKSRCHTLLRLIVNVNDWCRWAYSSGRIADEVIAFIRFKPEYLSDFKPSREFKNSPSPRTVEHASDLFKAGITHPAFLAGACGEAWALDFISFLRVYADLPSIDGILIEPTNAKVPATVGARWAVSSALVKRATKDNLGRIIIYLKRLTQAAGRDYEIMTMKDILKVNPDCTQSPDFPRWASDNDDVMGG